MKTWALLMLLTLAIACSEEFEQDVQQQNLEEMALGTTDISTTIVKNILSESSNDVGTLCKSTAINKWSFYKPVSLEKTTGLTDSDFWDTNDGFAIPVNNSPIVILNGKSGTNTLRWDYIKPNGGQTSPFRLGDFRGYDHNAIDWFIFSMPDTLKPVGYDTYIDIPTNLIDLFQFAEFENEVLQLGFLITQSTATNQTSCTYYPVTDNTYPTIADLDDSITLPGSLFQNVGTYYIIPVLTNYQYTLNVPVSVSETSNGTWWAFDSSKMTYQTESVEVIPSIYSITTQLTGEGYLEITQLTLQFNNQFTISKDIDYDVTINNEPGYTEFNYSNTLTVSASSTANVVIINSSSYICRAETPRLMVTVDWGTDSKVYYFDLM